MTKTFLRLLLLTTLFSISSIAQIPKIVETAENLQRGRELIEKARTYILNGKEYSKIKKIDFNLAGESIQELTATQPGNSNAQTHTRNLKIEERVSFALPYDLTLEMKAKSFDDMDTEIIHRASREGRSSKPDPMNHIEAVKNYKFFVSLPDFNILNDIRGFRSWVYVFPILLKNYYGKGESHTKYVYVGKAAAPTGNANVVAAITEDALNPILFLDSETNQLLKMTIDVAGGKMEVFPGNYKLISGIRVPETINLKQNTTIRDEYFGFDKKTVIIRETKLSNFVIE